MAEVEAWASKVSSAAGTTNIAAYGGIRRLDSGISCTSWISPLPTAWQASSRAIPASTSASFKRVTTRAGSGEKGESGGHSGRGVIDVIGRGRLWLKTWRLNGVDGRYAPLLEQLFNEMRELAAGFVTLRRGCGLFTGHPTGQRPSFRRPCATARPLARQYTKREVTAAPARRT
jgi:hypothetical protein